MNPVQIQGIVFSGVAILVAAAAAFLPRFSPQTELVVMAALVVGLGAPHGALDTVFAGELFRLRSFRSWLLFVTLYLLLAAFVVGFWRIFPALFLAVFLFISLVHFSGDPQAGTPLVSRILYGGAILFLPHVFYSAEVTGLFSFLVGPTAGYRVAAGMQPVAGLWLLGLAIAAAHRASSDWLTALEMVAVGLLTVFAPPLLAFTLFFCGMHGARHILRTVKYSGRSFSKLLAASALAPTLGFMCALAAAFYWLRHLPWETRLVQMLFVGLAALTVPHMVLVEQVRFSGWARKPACLP
jgi:Brp/Blh family beta-carotene 15,15'-monooxygenase